MPTYEYRCPANGCLVEVRHGMAERLLSWGELCERAGITPGVTDPASPVEKLISAAFLATSSSAEPCAGGGCEAGGCEAGGCGSGFCGTGNL